VKVTDSGHSDEIVPPTGNSSLASSLLHAAITTAEEKSTRVSARKKRSVGVEVFIGEDVLLVSNWLLTLNELLLCRCAGKITSRNDVHSGYK
jgi:hypothetical protein